MGDVTNLIDHQFAPDDASGSGGTDIARTLPASHIARKAEKDPATVAILLGTHNGQAFLPEQLDSFARQTHANWRVWASDDGSTDNTLSILQTYREKWSNGRLEMLSGPCKGYAANFLGLACKPEIEADYFAFSDQDDIWEPEKLQRAIDWFQQISDSIPALYCTRAELIDAAGKSIGHSPLFRKPPSFPNALVQSIGGANTMVFNRAARDLLREAGHDIDVNSHDCWAYLVVSACGGRVHHDIQPSLRYRQHAGNVVGANRGWLAKMQRLGMLFDGHLRDWNDRHIRALQKLRARMTPHNRALLDSFSLARNEWMLPRVMGIWRVGLYRQTALDNLALLFAAIFKKI